MLETGSDIIEHYNVHKNERTQFETTWIDIADDVLGLRNFDINQDIKGQTRHKHIYDQTGLNWGMLMASMMHGIVTNPGARFHASQVPKGIRDIGENNDYLVHIDEVMDGLYKDPKHGFPTAATEWWIDYIFFGTSGMYTADVAGIGPVDHARPLGELVVDEASNGMIDTVYRLSKPSARQFVQEYGPEAHLPTTKMAMGKQFNMEVPVIHLVHPRSDLNIESDARGDARPMRSVHVVQSDKTIVRESGMASDPWQVARYLKEAGEKYGRGPAWMALSDCQTASELARIVLESGQKNLDPALFLPDDGVLTQIDTSPRGINIYRAGALDRDAIRQAPAGDLSNSSIQALQHTRQQIKDRFYGDLIDPSGAAGGTATAFLETENKAARILTSVVSRAASEFVSKSLRRKHDIASRAGMYDDPPDTMQGVPIRVVYLSPVMRFQKQADNRATLNGLTAAGQVQPFFPDVFDNFDGDYYAREFMENEGGDLGGLISVEERDAVRQMRAQQQQQQEQMEKLQQVASMGKDLSGIQKATEGMAQKGADGS